MSNHHRAMRIMKQIQNMKKSYQSQAIEILEVHQTDYGIFLIHGPLQSPYQGFVFRVKVTWPQHYPINGIIVQILDPIWNPYISKQGNICLDILEQKWTPALTTFTVLLSIISLLSQKKIAGEQFLNPLAASQTKTNYYYFFDYAKNQAQKLSHAKKQIYHDQMRSKEEQVQVLEKQDGKVESEIEKALIQKKIKQKKYEDKYQDKSGLSYLMQSFVNQLKQKK